MAQRFVLRLKKLWMWSSPHRCLQTAETGAGCGTHDCSCSGLLAFSPLLLSHHCECSQEAAPHKPPRKTWWHGWGFSCASLCGGVSPMGSFLHSCRVKKKDREILCTLHPVSPDAVQLLYRKDVDIGRVKIQNIHHHRSLLLPCIATPTSLTCSSH